MLWETRTAFALVRFRMKKEQSRVPRLGVQRAGKVWHTANIVAPS